MTRPFVPVFAIVLMLVLLASVGAVLSLPSMACSDRDREWRALTEKLRRAMDSQSETIKMQDRTIKKQADVLEQQAQVLRQATGSVKPPAPRSTINRPVYHDDGSMQFYPDWMVEPDPDSKITGGYRLKH